ncbi:MULTISPECIES: metalloregulator ArsR/SmtB family transcription factor [unclassified Pseudoalteromonas]|uniref:metalloregulator ArsR/SmtB family transcription factor n=1 Tax=unclassified Pseudoalteromonas TaxID=194690 RepID=UPI000C0852CA|nr:MULTISPECIES: metalloregulator ArsR/SmtB family transcription factor [unclassified Pseudoalteromonas]MDP2636506.1 metalloregulator ArsR/SmtB family transcription factor [Pseudoalteromonas sp. 1_MG-2023]PHN90168.1 ArsR family transcriptional regulator [Pseudoalteromonas sp. 3D05]
MSNQTSANKRSVLFLCTGNSARSQMAEALLRHKAGDLFDIFSAGTSPELIDPRTLDAIEKFGLTIDNLKSKSVDEFSGKEFDFVITLCDKANKECRNFPGAKAQLAWDFPDPKGRCCNNPFATTLSELNNRLSMFLLLESKNQPNNKTALNLRIDEQISELDSFTIDPVSFYKCLTDDIRLKTLMLTNYHGELCVCELMEALQEDSQPKVSRNLAVLKRAGIITDRKHGQWVFYRINPDLPIWIKKVISETTESNLTLIANNLDNLANMRNRPSKTDFCR